MPLSVKAKRPVGWWAGRHNGGSIHADGDVVMISGFHHQGFAGVDRCGPGSEGSGGVVADRCLCCACLAALVFGGFRVVRCGDRERNAPIFVFGREYLERPTAPDSRVSDLAPAGSAFLFIEGRYVPGGVTYKVPRAGNDEPAGSDTTSRSSRRGPADQPVGTGDRMTGARGVWVKSKSARRSPSWLTFSRTPGRGSGRPSVAGSRR